MNNLKLKCEENFKDIWKDLKDEQPRPGEVCEVQLGYTVKAIYNPQNDIWQWRILETKDNKRTSKWKVVAQAKQA